MAEPKFSSLPEEIVVKLRELEIELDEGMYGLFPSLPFGTSSQFCKASIHLWNTMLCMDSRCVHCRMIIFPIVFQVEKRDGSFGSVANDLSSRISLKYS